jgi:MFS family permease
VAVRRQRWAIATIFAVHGAVAGTFATRIPAIAEHLHLTPGALGLALVMPAVGSLSTMPLTGRLIHRVGARAATRLLIAALCLVLALPALASSLPVLCLTMVVLGAASGTSDIAMNAEGSALEQRMGTSIMSSLHGMWSIGGFVAAGIGTAAARADVGARPHLAVMALLLLAVGQLAGAWLPADAVPAGGGAVDRVPAGGAVSAGGAAADGVAVDRPRFGLPSGIVLVIGLVAFCAVFAEAAGADWAAVYMRDMLGSGHATAAATYGVFAASMAVMRLLGDRVVRRFGAARTVRSGAAGGAAGGALMVVRPGTAGTIVGFGLLGVGIAVVVPLAFAAAGRVGSAGGHAGTGNAIAGVATIAYGSGLAAPGAIGGVADLTSLAWSFVLVTALVVVIVAAAGVLGTGAPDPARPPEPSTPLEALR